MKLVRTWMAACCRCKTATQVYRSESHITQAQAVRKLRAEGWGSHLGDPLCPDCKKGRPSVVEVIKTLKAAGNGGD